MPFRDCDSTCSMSFTNTMMPRSTLVVMRRSISWGSRPVYVHTWAITGMLISGKISVGVRGITTAASSAITSAITINVYGLDRAKRTIHIGYVGDLGPGERGARYCGRSERFDLSNLY